MLGFFLRSVSPYRAQAFLLFIFPKFKTALLLRFVIPAQAAIQRLSNKLPFCKEFCEKPFYFSWIPAYGE
jgi:hypothetical protein